MHLERVDALQAQLGGSDRGQPVGPSGLVELVQQLGVGGSELDGVAVGSEAGAVAGLGVADQVEGPLDQDERHGPSNHDTAGTLLQHGKQQKGDTGTGI
jgi:hypothetical protein